MKAELNLCLRDTPENRQKAEFLTPLEVAFDDPFNLFPEEYFWFTENMPYGTKFRVTLEVISTTTPEKNVPL